MAYGMLRQFMATLRVIKVRKDFLCYGEDLSPSKFSGLNFSLFDVLHFLEIRILRPKVGRESDSIFITRSDRR